MKKYDVSIVVIGQQLASIELATKFALVQAKGEDSKWVMESNLPCTATLQAHIDSLLSQIGSDDLAKIASGSKELYLDIAAFYDTANCSITLPSQQINKLFSLFQDMDIEITCYPCDETTG